MHEMHNAVPGEIPIPPKRVDCQSRPGAFSAEAAEYYLCPDNALPDLQRRRIMRRRLRRMYYYSLQVATGISMTAPLWVGVLAYLYRHSLATVWIITAPILALVIGFLLTYAFQAALPPKYMFDNSAHSPDPTREELRDAVARYRQYIADNAAHEARWKADIKSYERSLDDYAAKILKKHGMEQKVPIDGALLALLSLEISNKIQREGNCGEGEYAHLMSLTEAAEAVKKYQPSFRDKQYGYEIAWGKYRNSRSFISFHPSTTKIWRVGEIEFSSHSGSWD
jgi:hypothetical protein